MRDQAELAPQVHATRAWTLLNLAPDIQEEILHLPRVESGWDPITEQELRKIVAEMAWGQAKKELEK